MKKSRTLWQLFLCLSLCADATVAHAGLLDSIKSVNPFSSKEEAKDSTPAADTPQAPSVDLSQPIEKVKITDSEMSCRQAYDELGSMDKVVAAAKEAQSAGETKATAGKAASVATDVASKTGLFGQLGGLTGHLLGTVAGQTASGMATQSGQVSAQQAAEREQQALARKGYLSELFTVRGCKASDPDAPAANPNAMVASLSSEIARASAPPVSIGEAIEKARASLTPLSTTLKLDSIKSDLRAYQRVVVPGFRVAFVQETGVKAHAGSGLANIGNSTGSSMKTITQGRNVNIKMSLAGADPELLQGITEKLYADFLERLRASGKEVIGYEELAKTAGFQKMKFLPTEKPYTTSPTGDPRTYLVMTPRSSPLWFMHIDSALGNAGPFEQGNTKAIHEICANLNAVALIPTIVIDFAQLESSGNSMFRSNAEADATPKIGLAAGTQMEAMNGKDAKIFYTGDISFAKLKAPFFVDGDFGEVKVVDATNDAALVNALTMATGTQGTQHFSEKREVRISPEVYASKVFQVGATVNQAFAGSLQ